MHSNPKIQGTPELVEAINKLKANGYSLIPIAIEGLPHKDVLKAMLQADVIVGKISRRMGWYGYIGMEGLALNKPTITYIKPSLRKYLAYSPFVETHPDHIYETLKRILDNPTILDKYRNGRLFVAKHHNHIRIARKWLKIYSEAA